jgi:hypothetical protein
MTPTLRRTSSPSRWDAGSTTPVELGGLTSFGFLPDTSWLGAANKINSTGTILGNLFGSSGGVNIKRGVRWDAGSITPVELKPIVAAGSTVAYDLNSIGIAVGTVTPGEVATADLTIVYKAGGRAVYWGADGAAVDLNSLIDPTSGWFLQAATSISDTGWIMGVGTFDPDGAGSQAAYSRMFLLQVPEPSAIVLGIIGVGATLALRKSDENCPR